MVFSPPTRGINHIVISIVAVVDATDCTNMATVSVVVVIVVCGTVLSAAVILGVPDAHYQVGFVTERRQRFLRVVRGVS